MLPFLLVITFGISRADSSTPSPALLREEIRALRDQAWYLSHQEEEACHNDPNCEFEAVKLSDWKSTEFYRKVAVACKTLIDTYPGIWDRSDYELLLANTLAWNLESPMEATAVWKKFLDHSPYGADAITAHAQVGALELAQVEVNDLAIADAIKKGEHHLEEAYTTEMREQLLDEAYMHLRLAGDAEDSRVSATALEKAAQIMDMRGRPSVASRLQFYAIRLHHRYHTLEIEPVEPEELMVLPLILNNLILLEYEQHAQVDAIQLFERLESELTKPRLALAMTVRLARVYFDKGELTEARGIAAELAARHPETIEAFQAEMMMLDPEKERNPEEGIETVNRLLVRYGPRTTWYKRLGTKARKTVDDNIETRLRSGVKYRLDTGLANSKEERRLGAPLPPQVREIIGSALTLYEQYVQFFPEAPQRAEVELVAAQSSLLLSMNKEAWAHYQTYLTLSTGLDGSSEHLHDTLNDSMLAAERWCGFKDIAQVQKQRLPLDEADEAYLMACDRYSKAYPTESDASRAAYRRALHLYNHGHFSESADGYLDALTKPLPPAERAAAIRGLIEALGAAEMWSRMADVLPSIKKDLGRIPLENAQETSMLIDDSLDRARFMVIEKKYPPNEGILEKLAKDELRQAARDYSSFSKDWPDSDYAPLAMHHTARALHYAGEREGEALILAQLIKRYPGYEKVPEEISRLGWLFFEDGKAEEAVRTWRELSPRLNSLEGTDLEKAIISLLLSARIDLSLGHYSSAEEEIDCVFAKTKHDLRRKALVDRAIVEQKLAAGEGQQAAAHFSRALSSWETLASDTGLRTDPSSQAHLYDAVAWVSTIAPDIARRYFDSLERLIDLPKDADAGVRMARENARLSLQSSVPWPEYEPIEGDSAAIARSWSQYEEAFLSRGQLFLSRVSLEIPPAASRAAQMMGHVWTEHARIIREAPIPTELTSNQRKNYRAALEDKADKAESTAADWYQGGLEISHAFHIYDSSTEESAKLLLPIDPSRNTPFSMDRLTKPLAESSEPTLNVAAGFLKSSRSDLAEVYLNEAKSSDPRTLANIHHGWALIALQRRNYAAASIAWEISLKKEPEHLAAREGRGILALRSGDYSQAREDLLHCSRAGILDKTGTQALAGALRGSGDIKGAEQMYQQMIDQDANDGYAWVELVRTLGVYGTEHDRALQVGRPFLEAHPSKELEGLLRAIQTRLDEVKKQTSEIEKKKEPDIKSFRKLWVTNARLVQARSECKVPIGADLNADISAVMEQVQVILRDRNMEFVSDALQLEENNLKRLQEFCAPSSSSQKTDER